VPSQGNSYPASLNTEERERFDLNRANMVYDDIIFENVEEEKGGMNNDDVEDQF